MNDDKNNKAEEETKENKLNESDTNQDNEQETGAEDNTKNQKTNENINNEEAESGIDSETEQSAEDELLEKNELLREEKIRLLAEMENLRKRSDKEKSEAIKYGSSNLARDILSPADNLERALNALPKENYPESIENLVEGLKMVLKEFTSILEKNGVKKIEALNKKFDHNYHQAIMEVEKEDVDEGIVIQEIQSGYMMHDRLLRPAMVGVSKKPSNEENEVNDHAVEDQNTNKTEKN